ncbi:MAG: glycosyltransferase [Alphaproteobacteria bacterium]|nr:glycosyltransferase [Alphaproteobacteria bacterium]
MPAILQRRSSSVKVALLIRELTTGGAQRQLALLACELNRRGHDVTVLTMSRRAEM